MNQLSMLDTLFPVDSQSVTYGGIHWSRDWRGVWRQNGGQIRAGDFAKPASKVVARVLDGLVKRQIEGVFLG